MAARHRSDFKLFSQEHYLRCFCHSYVAWDMQKMNANSIRSEGVLCRRATVGIEEFLPRSHQGLPQALQLCRTDSVEMLYGKDIAETAHNSEVLVDWYPQMPKRLNSSSSTLWQWQGVLWDQRLSGYDVTSGHKEEPLKLKQTGNIQCSMRIGPGFVSEVGYWDSWFRMIGFAVDSSH